MGQEIIQSLKNDTDIELVGESGRDDDLAKMIREEKADVVVDFTHPDTAYRNSRIILESGCHAVVGTTGITQEQRNELHKLAMEKSRGIVIAPNFSIGAVLMMRFAAEASKWLKNAEIVEYHHAEKADAPSGTALATAEMMLEASGGMDSPSVQTKEMLQNESRGGNKEGIRIHAVRLPGFIASQEVLFGGTGEILTIRHDSTGRNVFIPGIFLAVRKVVGLKGLIYGLEKILF